MSTVSGLFTDIDGKLEYDSDAHKLELAQARIDRKVSEFEQQKARLYRKDGKQVYGLQEHQERIDAMLEPVREAVAEAKQVAEEVRKRCDEEAQIQNADPLLMLTDAAEQAEVNHKLVLIENAATKLPLHTLAQRLEAITLHGSKVEKLLYARFARRRMEEVQAHIQQQGRTNPLSWGERSAPVGRYTPPEGYGQVVSALKALEAATEDPKLKARLKRVEDRRNAATGLTMHASKRLREADGSEERARHQQINRVRNYI